MTREDFAECMVLLFVGIGKPADQQTIRVYFELLGHLDAKVFRAACANVLLSHKWATFPSIAELHEAALKLTATNQLTSGEAFALAREAAARIDPELSGPHRVYVGNGQFIEYESQAAAVMGKLPPPVARAIEVFGVRELCKAESPDGVLRAQFTKVYEQLAEREKGAAALPPAVREFIEGKAKPKAAIEQRRDASKVIEAIGGMA